MGARTAAGNACPIIDSAIVQPYPVGQRKAWAARSRQRPARQIIGRLFRWPSGCRALVRAR